MRRLSMLAVVASWILFLPGVSPAEASGRRSRIHFDFWFSPSWYLSWGWPGVVWYGPPAAVYRSTYRGLGALDVDISPDRAEVWVDGEVVGVADDFDGFPTYLWLEPGTYDVVFYLPGYRTLARQYTIRPGMVISVEDRLEPGESTHPTDLASRSTERRDERLRRREERRRELALERDPGLQDASAVGTPLTEEQWEALRLELEALRQVASEGARPEEVRRVVERIEALVSAKPSPEASAPAVLRLRVEPEDAAVYLDGRLLGSGSELARLRDGLLLEDGEHLLEVVRPGRKDHVQRFVAESGARIELEIVLEEP